MSRSRKPSGEGRSVKEFRRQRRYSPSEPPERLFYRVKNGSEPIRISEEQLLAYKDPSSPEVELHTPFFPCEDPFKVFANGVRTKDGIDYLLVSYWNTWTKQDPELIHRLIPAQKCKEREFEPEAKNPFSAEGRDPESGC